MSASDVAALPSEELAGLAAEASRQMASLAGLIVLLSGEIDRRETWREDGAASLEAWLSDRLGCSAATARTYKHVGERLFDLPHLAGALSAGEIGLDKVRAVVDAATPESDRELSRQAREFSVPELARLARQRRRPTPERDRAEHDRRSLRFNDACRTVTAQLPASSYAELRACLEARAKQIGSDGETPLDQRLADALMKIIRESTRGAGRGKWERPASPWTLVAHLPFELMADPESTLCGELERGGFVSAEVIRRLACDATLIIAADDDAGRTMYEGRAVRLATEAQRRELLRRDRHCRFPGCGNVGFVIPHHIDEWQHGGLTDLPNLALLCAYHHHLIHTKVWQVSGNGNEDLYFVGPADRIMTSRPSPLWAAVTEQRRQRDGPP